MFFNNFSQNIISTLEESNRNKLIPKQITYIADLIKDIDKKHKLIAIFGNGGSAADSQHFAAELMCTYKNKKRKPYKALALTTDTSIITAWSNDFNFDSVFERQVEALNNQIGLAIGLSTSGKSKSVLKALEKANKLEIKTCLISGIIDKKNSYIDLSIEIPSKDTPIIQTITQVIYHSVCNELEI